MIATATVTVTASGLYCAVVRAGQSASARSIGGRPASAIKGACEDLAIDGYRISRVKVVGFNGDEDDLASYQGRVLSPNVGWVGYSHA